ncbi:MAG: NADH-quinone oxidoreductase subunit M [Thermodesulfobacteriota bacterium]
MDGGIPVMLAWLIAIPLIGGTLAWIADRRSVRAVRWISLAAMVLELFLVLSLRLGDTGFDGLAAQAPWFGDFRVGWIPELGVGFHLAMDGLSLLMVALTSFLGIVSVVCSWTEITQRVGLFHFNLLASLAGIVGVFLATDLLLFYFFWELMLVPMYFLIGIWGHERRLYAAIKFFIFTQAGGLVMLAAIVGLYFVHGRATGEYTFDYFKLVGTPMDPRVAMWLMLGFFVAFAVKLPMVPFHTWLPDAHTEAPTAGSVLLAGLLLKTGAYGLIRFVVPLFPGAASAFGHWAMLLGVIGILYGAVLAFAQTDFKRLVAYTSVSHLGFVLLGVFAFNDLGLTGAVLQMICHGISTGALFVIAGLLQERLHTREMARMGGLWTTVPLMAGMALCVSLASLGLPGMGNFVGEFLVLLGAYGAHPVMVIPAVAGLVLAAIYSLWLMLRAFLGPESERWNIPDLSAREQATLVVMVLSLLWLGLHPNPVIWTAAPSVEYVKKAITRAPGMQLRAPRPACTPVSGDEDCGRGRPPLGTNTCDLGLQCVTSVPHFSDSPIVATGLRAGRRRAGRGCPGLDPGDAGHHNCGTKPRGIRNRICEKGHLGLLAWVRTPDPSFLKKKESRFSWVSRTQALRGVTIGAGQFMVKSQALPMTPPVEGGEAQTVFPGGGETVEGPSTCFSDSNDFGSRGGSFKRFAKSAAWSKGRAAVVSGGAP